jgi:AcrR family transcriptional regulator
MERTQQKRRLLTEQMADHLLQYGFAAFTLRSLGAATGTSDRMLLHYFADKNDLLAATLTLVAERLLSSLQRLQPDKMGQQELIGFLAGLLNSPEITPYTNLWLELTAVAIREGEPYRTVAGQIAVAFLDWIKAHLAFEDATGNEEAAAFILTFVEGLVLLNAIAQADEASRALGWALRGN